MCKEDLFCSWMEKSLECIGVARVEEEVERPLRSYCR